MTRKENEAQQAAAQVSDDGQALAALAAAVGENLAATNGGFTGAIANLAGTLEAVWAECRLHSSKAKKG